jgi:hypothetical protein
MSPIKRFLDPTKSAPWHAFFTASQAIFQHTLGFISIETFRQLINALQAHESIFWHSILFFSLLCLLFVIQLLCNFFNAWHHLLSPIRTYINTTYMHKFLLLNNEEVAKYGVGRMISVLQK